MRTIELVFHDENESVLAQIRRACQDAELEPHLVSIAQTVAKVFFYMQQPGAQLVQDRQYSATLAQLAQRGVRKAAKLSRKIMRLYDHVVVGPAPLCASTPWRVVTPPATGALPSAALWP